MDDDGQAAPRRVGAEARKSQARRTEDGFVDRYLSGSHILDVGYKGRDAEVVPIVPQAIGVDIDYPGYDGRTLPFPDGSQDAVFSSHCLEHIGHSTQTLRDWFRVLRTGGFLVITVPHQFLYEKRESLPSRFNVSHRRFYTPASLMDEVEAALPPNAYRLRHLADNDRHYDYTITPDRHPGGCYEIELVLEKIAPPAWLLDDDGRAQAKAADAETWRTAPTRDVVHECAGGTQRIQVLPASPWNVAVYEFGHDQPARRHVLAMQLGHMGDFIIGLPALRALRAAFPHDHLRLVTGPWNRGVAEATGLADEVTTHEHFPAMARHWNGRPVQDAEAFARAAAGQYDVAVDLRVDSDTRHLLQHVDAALRCGIGTIARFPFLDVALPISRPSPVRATGGQTITLSAGDFRTRMSRPGAFRQTHNYRRTNTHVIFGPGTLLPPGRYRAVFGLALTGLRLSPRPVRIGLDVLQGTSRVLAERIVPAADIPRELGDDMAVEFENEDATDPLDFRVHIVGRPLLAKLSFYGVRIEPQVGGVAALRHRPASLHIGEQLSLLVQLVADRTRPLYPPTPTGRPEAGRRIVVAPVSNSDLRDWPPEHYASLVGMLVRRLDCTVLLTGSHGQAATTRRIARESGGGERVLDLAGKTEWAELPDLLHGADLVICNNSGIAHLAASLGVRTLALYSASHQPQEWGPRGAASRALMAVVPCSPCGLDRLSECPHGHACMQGLLPETVFAQVRDWMDQAVLAA